jgi:hypothetical protein
MHCLRPDCERFFYPRRGKHFCSGACRVWFHRRKAKCGAMTPGEQNQAYFGFAELVERTFGTDQALSYLRYNVLRESARWGVYTIYHVR